MVTTTMAEPMENRRPDPQELSLLGGRLCLDFANTIDWRGTERRRDWLPTYEDLIAWSVHAGALTPRLARSLRSRAALNPKQAQAVHKRAVALRDAVYGVGSALAKGNGPPPTKALEELNRELFRIGAHTRLRLSDNRVVREWAGEPDTLERVLWPIAWSTFDLLTGPALDRLRECADQECHWLFVDQSKNRSRRWCAMSNCGNLTKVRRYRRRAP